MIEGVDVYERNGDIDWHKVKHAGKQFAVIKVNQGDRIDARATAGRVDALRAEGIIVGGYAFVHPRPGRTGAEEWSIHFDHAKAIGLYKKGDMRPVIDLEPPSGFNVSTADGQHATLVYVSSWIHACFDATGHHPILYTGFFWRDHLGDPNTTMGCQLWYPSYPTLKLVPRAWGPSNVAIHQYSEHGAVDGVHGDVDLNRYIQGDGSLASFSKHMCLQFEH